MVQIQKPLRVIVVDDEPMMLSAVSAVVKDEPWLELAGTAPGVSEAIALAKQEQPDVVLLDVRMPEGGGPAVLQGLRQVAPHSRAIAYTAEADGSLLHEMIGAGALGYVLKGSAVEDLLDIVRQAGQVPAADPDHDRDGDWDNPEPSRARAGVLIAHPDQGVLDALTEVLAGDGEVELVGAASTLAAAVLLARQEEVSVALVDTAFPDVGTHLAHALVRAVPALKVIRMALLSDRALLDGLMSSGVTGCIVSVATAWELRSAVREAVGHAGSGHPSGGAGWSRTALEGGLVVATRGRPPRWSGRTCP
ncbi:MAG TPA: response regulator [Actinomycetota bacterium]|nr:response regulator [Actinomycetota bacterium]